MRKNMLFIFFLWVPVIANSQDNKTQNKNPYDVNFTFKTDQQPFYPAGDVSLYTYFYNTVKYSEQAVASKISGEVMISFYVMPDSTLSEINVLSGVGYGIDEEVAKALEPLKYAPGIIDGEKVKMNVIIYVPVNAH
jgi:outer membrane biosynthesis protein TonB